MQHIYKDIYLDSNGDLFVIEKGFLSKNPNMTNITKIVASLKKDEMI